MTSTIKWGGKVTHLDNPLTWINGATGDSDAYVIPLGDVKLVILSVENVATPNVNDGAAVAKFPVNLYIPEDQSVRLPLNEKVMLASQGNSTLFLYTQEVDKAAVGRWGMAFYFIHNN